MKPIRVVLADDHTLVRAGIRVLLQNIAGIEVVGEAGDGVEALDLIQTLQPDVVLADIAMPAMTGLELATKLSQEMPNVRVIIFSMHANEEYVWQALRAGAVGYLLKGARTPELELAVMAVARGETYLSPAVSKYVIGGYVQGNVREPEPAIRLTPRQREILKLIAAGYTRKQISQKINISVKTFDSHRAQLMEQLGVNDVAGLVRYVMESGLLDRDK